MINELSAEEKAFLKKEGFTLHDGKDAPVSEGTRVIAAVRVKYPSSPGTHDGIALARLGPAYIHVWEEELHSHGLGAPVAYKLADAKDSSPVPIDRSGPPGHRGFFGNIVKVPGRPAA